jgi:hypothetical protein
MSTKTHHKRKLSDASEDNHPSKRAATPVAAGMMLVHNWDTVDNIPKQFTDLGYDAPLVWAKSFPTVERAQAYMLEQFIKIDQQFGLHYDVCEGPPTEPEAVAAMNAKAAAQYEGKTYAEALGIFQTLMGHLDVDAETAFFVPFIE